MSAENVIHCHSSITIVPESGHHFYFVPLSMSAVPDGTCRWEYAMDNTTRKKLLWLRGRLTVMDGKPGLCYAIETNAGLPDRGWPHERWIKDERGAVNAPVEAAHHVEAYLLRGWGINEPTSHAREVNFLFGSVSAGSRVSLNLSIDVVEGSDSVDVDLVIDFGNTRTVVVAVERGAIPVQGADLSQLCGAVQLAPRDQEPEPDDEENLVRSDSSAIVDSWMVLAEPIFSCLETRSNGAAVEEVPCIAIENLDPEKRWILGKPIHQVKWRRIRPHACVQLSPAVFGPEAEEMLSELSLDRSSNSFLGSAKRYFWDMSPLQGNTQWTMHVPPWHRSAQRYRDKKEIPRLQGVLLGLMPATGSNWLLDSSDEKLPTELDNPPNESVRPQHPRADALTWAALALLEAGHRYIQSDRWRKKMNNQLVRRKLANVVVTFPSGWSGEELETYRDKWQRAVDLFSVTRLANCRNYPLGMRPRLRMELDEAVASQLPIIYGEIERLRTSARGWIELVGRGEGRKATVRVMNIDIGGGSSDIAVVEYIDHEAGSAAVDLRPKVLYQDGSTVAGDMLVKRVIETTLMPIFVDRFEATSPEAAKNFKAFVSGPKGNNSSEWARVVRQVLIPIVRYWLKQLGEGGEKTAAPVDMDIPPGAFEIFKKIVDLKSDSLNNLKEAVFTYGVELHPNWQKIYGSVREVFRDYFASLGKVAVAFDCDLLMVSGKPSELPEVQRLLRESIPVSPRRILFSKGYDIGSWYPLGLKGVVDDAKTVTAAGAAVYMAAHAGVLNNWQISKPERELRSAVQNIWGVIGPSHAQPFQPVLLDRTEMICKNKRVMVGAAIGRLAWTTRARPDPVYRLRWSAQGRARGLAAGFIIATFERMSAPSSGQGFVQEKLRLTDVKSDPQRPQQTITHADVELALCTLEDEVHWIDRGEFFIAP